MIRHGRLAHRGISQDRADAAAEISAHRPAAVLPADKYPATNQRPVRMIEKNCLPRHIWSGTINQSNLPCMSTISKACWHQPSQSASARGCYGGGNASKCCICLCSSNTHCVNDMMRPSPLFMVWHLPLQDCGKLLCAQPSPIQSSRQHQHLVQGRTIMA